MRLSLLLPWLLLPLAACGDPTGALVAVNVASVAVFQRAVPDLVISAVTGKDCSVVRLDQGKSYCAAQQPPPARPPYCTRSLGAVDCWSDPENLPGPPPQVADGPSTLTPEQEENRTRRWPGL
jgi:hypothetical protein